MWFCNTRTDEDSNNVCGASLVKVRDSHTHSTGGQWIVRPCSARRNRQTDYVHDKSVHNTYAICSCATEALLHCGSHPRFFLKYTIHITGWGYRSCLCNAKNPKDLRKHSVCVYPFFHQTLFCTYVPASTCYTFYINCVLIWSCIRFKTLII